MDSQELYEQNILGRSRQSKAGGDADSELKPLSTRMDTKLLEIHSKITKQKEYMISAAENPEPEPDLAAEAAKAAEAEQAAEAERAQAEPPKPTKSKLAAAEAEAEEEEEAERKKGAFGGLCFCC